MTQQGVTKVLQQFQKFESVVKLDDFSEIEDDEERKPWYTSSDERWTQKQIADALGVSQKTVHQWVISNIPGNKTNNVTTSSKKSKPDKRTTTPDFLGSDAF